MSESTQLKIVQDHKLESNRIIQGNCIKELKEFPDNSIDALVSDPPYSIGFMGSNWDSFTDQEFMRFNYKWSKTAYPKLKPGGHLVAFSSPRTYDLLAVGIRFAGFEIRSMLMWLYGSSFTKGADISKDIDKMFGKLNNRETIGYYLNPDGRLRNFKNHNNVETYSYGDFVEKYNSKGRPITNPATKLAKQWDGWHSNLKSLHEPIVLARKPIDCDTIAENVLKWGVGALNIDGCRLNYTPAKETDNRIGTDEEWHGKREPSEHTVSLPAVKGMKMYKQKGRYPPNVLLTHHPKCKLIGTKKVGKGDPKHNQEINRKPIKFDGPFTPQNSGFDFNKCQGLGNYGEELQGDYLCHPDCPIRILDEQSGDLDPSGRPNLMGNEYNTKGVYTNFSGGSFNVCHLDNGGASRFFYNSKAHKSERNAGCEDLYWKKKKDDSLTQITKLEYNNLPRDTRRKGNPIISLKPINVMRWLVRLVCPKGGVVLDPFGGSGTTGIACIIEGMNYLLIEQRETFAKTIIPRRLNYWSDHNNWDLLKDHNSLPKIEDLQMKKRYGDNLNELKEFEKTSINEWL